MLKYIHRQLIRNPITRPWQHRFARRVKQAVGCPDPYSDIGKVMRQQKPDAFLDVGCHLGNTIVRISDEHQLRIFGFEPTSGSYKSAVERFRGNQGVEIHNVALSNANGTARFFCNANEQTNSLLDNDIGNEEFDQWTKHVDEEEVKTQRLDDWCAEHYPSGKMVIKCDIQGAEGLFVEGGRETLANRTLALFSEAQIAPMYEGQADFFELNRILTQELGFALVNIYPCMQNAEGLAVQTDALWIRTD